MNQTSPTRLNLLSLKIRYGLAKDGVRMLRSKREVLVREFFVSMKDVAEVRDIIEKKLDNAFTSITLARVFLGDDILKSTAYAYKRDIDVNIKSKNVMGVIVPEIEDVNLKRAIDARGTSPISEPYRINEVTEKFEDVLGSIVSVASKEIRLKRLGSEIQTTSRRINALEEILIPSLAKRIKYIQRMLEEKEREGIFRLKRFKGRRKKVDMTI